MIPVKEDRTVISKGVEESIAFGISAKDSVHIMGILRDQLYSDKIMAVLREIGANAADANAMAGRADEPIEVTLPTLADPTLRIRDHGPGLSLDDVRLVFSQYGASTKRDSNEVVGMLGIGSKSPFAYADSFIVTSWHAGSRATYNAIIDASGAGRIDLLAVDDCGPDESGIELSMAVHPKDCRAFEERAHALFVHFEPRPRINTTLPDPPKTREVPNGRILDEESYRDHKWIAVMGHIPYPIDLHQLSSGSGGGELSRAAQRVSGTLYFDIGALQFAASREALKYGDATRALLIERINQAIDDYVRMMLEGIEALPGWERRLRVRALHSRGLPIPVALRPLSEYSISFKTSTVGPKSVPMIEGQDFFLQTRNYNNRMTAVNTIVVDRSVRLVLKDDKRAMSGYALSQQDIVVSRIDATGPTGSPASAAKEFARFLKAYQIDGIPVVALSSIKWTKPESTKASVPRDKEKARARVLVLDAALIKAGETGSSVWVAREHVPSDSDVFVVLESYRVPRMESFYDSVREDEAMLRNLGLQLPPVIGYKSTKAHPVTASGRKGTEYHKWRWAGMVQLLMTNPEVARVVSAMAFTKEGQAYGDGSPGNWFRGSGDTWIAGKLGREHPLIELAAMEGSGRMALDKASALVTRAATFAFSSPALKRGLEGSKLRVEITKRYPLLSAAPDGALSGSNKDLWVDYVRLIDSINPPQPRQETESSEEAAA